MENKNKQRTWWLLAALSAPLAHFSGCGWLSASLAAAVILPLTLVPKCWEGMSRPLAQIQILWLGLLPGLLLKNSAYYWPSDNELVVPLSLLALAAITPKSSAPRIGAVLAMPTGMAVTPAPDGVFAMAVSGMYASSVTSFTVLPSKTRYSPDVRI